VRLCPQNMRHFQIFYCDTSNEKLALLPAGASQKKMLAPFPRSV